MMIRKDGGVERDYPTTRSKNQTWTFGFESLKQCQKIQIRTW